MSKKFLWVFAISGAVTLSIAAVMSAALVWAPFQNWYIGFVSNNYNEGLFEAIFCPLAVIVFAVCFVKFIKQFKNRV